MITGVTAASVPAGKYFGLQDKQEPVRPRRKTVDERLHDFFENSKLNEQRPLENFRGDRKIEAFKGTDFVNKETTKFATETAPELRLIRNFIRVPIKGTKNKKFQYLDNAIGFITDEGRNKMIIRQNVPGDSSQGVVVTILRLYNQAVKKYYDNYAEMRKDEYIQWIIKQFTKKIKR